MERRSRFTSCYRRRRLALAIRQKFIPLSPSSTFLLLMATCAQVSLPLKILPDIHKDDFPSDPLAVLGLRFSSPSLLDRSSSLRRDLGPGLARIDSSSAIVSLQAVISSKPASYSRAVGSGSLTNLRKIGPSTSVEGGTPSVMAPDTVLLQSSEVWKDYLVAHFHGSPPSPARVFSYLNPIWGTHGRIAIRKYSPQSYLVFIPSEATRKWVLEVRFWQSGNCAFTITSWSSRTGLAPMKLDYAPLWVILSNVPEPLLTFDGISVIASGLGHPFYTEDPKLIPNRFGLVKVKVAMKLDHSFPSAVRVKDKLGNMALAQAEFPHVSQKFSICSEFGHLPLRCPDLIQVSPSITKSSTPIKVSKHSDIPSAVSPIPIPTKSRASTQTIFRDKSGGNVISQVTKIATVWKEIPAKVDGLSRSRSLHSCSDWDGEVSSKDWTKVVRRSKHVHVDSGDGSTSRKEESLSSSKFHEEEDLIIAAHKLIRLRANSTPPIIFISSARSRKRERCRMRHKLIAEGQAGTSHDKATIYLQTSSGVASGSEVR